VGCEELLVELQGRQGDFEDRNAKLVVLGSQPEPLDVTKTNVEEHHITYTLLHDADTSVTKDIGLWSDMMEMPWMGYLIIDKSGRVAASDLQLSESKGAGPDNVSEILASLDEAQQTELSRTTPSASR
jgi:peroxiredoxin